MPSVAGRLASGREPVVEISREYINVETAMPQMERDPDWRFVDAAGHVHTYRSRRWKWVVTSVCGCSICWDDGEPYEYGEYRCTVCGALVEPRRRPVRNPVREVPGLWRGTLKIEGKTYFLRGTEIEAYLAQPGLVLTDEWVGLVMSREPEIDAGPLYAAGFREF